MCERGGVAVGWCWEMLAVEDRIMTRENKTRVGLTIEQRLSTLVAQPGHNMMMCSQPGCYLQVEAAGRWEGQPGVPP